MQTRHLRENKNHNLIPVLQEINLILHNNKDTDNRRMDMDHNQDIHHKDNRCTVSRCTGSRCTDNHTDNQCTNNKEADDSVEEV